MNKTTDKTTAGAGIRVWGIHATMNPDLLIGHGCIACGFKEAGDFSKLPREREAFKKAYAELRRKDGVSKEHVANVATQILAFAWEAKAGDCVVYAAPNRMGVHVGRITGEYEHRADSADSYKNVRSVEWLCHAERGSFTAGAQNALKNLGTFWEIGARNPSIRNEFLARGGFPCAEVAEKSHEEWVYENLYERLGGEGFERFVAAMFRLYGYDVETTARSGDHGVDLVATRTDALWSQRSVVQVKCCRGRSSEAEVQQLAGVLKCGERGVFVSYAGLREAARKCAAEKGIAVIDGRRVCTLALWNEERLAKDWPQVFAHGA